MIKKTLSDAISKEDNATVAESSVVNKFLPDRLENLPRILFYIFAALLPVWFLPINIGVEFSREISFSVIVAVAFLLWLLQVLSRGEFYYRRSIIYLGILAFLFTSILSAFFSASPLYSIFSSEIASEKISALLLGVVTIFLIGSIARDQIYGIKALFFLIFAGAISGIYSILHFFEILRIPLDFTRSVDFNVIGTVNALALFYSILFLMCLAALSVEKGKLSPLPRNINFAFLIAAIIFISNLLIINYQYSWVTLLLGSVFLMGLRFAVNQAGRTALNKRAILMLVIIAFSILMIMIRTPIFKSPNLPAEVSPSAGATINIGKSVMKEGVKNCLLGSGPATFGLDFSRHKDVAINATPFWALRFNQGFSYILTILATHGLLGLLALLGFLSKRFTNSFIRNKNT